METANSREFDKMKQHRNMPQMKDQDKTTEEQQSEVKISNLLEEDYRITIVKMIQDLRKVNGGTD